MKIFQKKFIQKNHQPIQDVIVTGISGGIIAESCCQKIPVACLFTTLNELYKYTSIDARASVTILNCISELLGDKIDVSTLIKDATKIEDAMIEVIQQIQSPQVKPPNDMFL